MRHVFVINPAAGKGKALDWVNPKIEALSKQPGFVYDIHVTAGPYEAIGYVREYAQRYASSGETLRFYACGGDGTVYEVVNGMWDMPNTEFTAVPLGSGNDFIRLFGERGDFLDMENVVNGQSVLLDLIRCGDQIAINQCSMGFDAEVCARQSFYKRLPLVSGEGAYIVAIFERFIKKVGHNFQIEIDGETIENGTTLLCVAGNSRWYGGGFMAAPRAMPNDGLLDFVMVTKNGSRFKLLPLFMKLRNGQHLDLPITQFKRGKTMTIRSESPAAVNIDGETKYVRECCFELLENAVRFVIPANSGFNALREQWEEKEKVFKHG